MKDIIVRAIAADGSIRMIATSTTNLVKEASIIHNCAPTAAAALGRTLTAALMMGVTLKGDEKITLQILGYGQIKKIVAVANTKGEVKGYISNPEVYLPPVDGKMPVGKAVGGGMLYVIKDLNLKEPYTGSVPLVSGEIAEDLTKYFLESEQVPSAVSLGVLAKKEGIVAAGGYIIQMLPGATDEMADKITKKVMELESVSTLIDKKIGPYDWINTVLGDYKPEILSETPAFYVCECSKEKLERILLGIGEEELKDILKEEGKVEAICHFCNKEYIFNKEEILNLIEEAK